MSRVVACASTSFSRGAVITNARALGKSPSVRPRHPASRKHVGSRIARRAADSSLARLALQNHFERVGMPLTDGTSITVRAMRPEDVRRVAEVMRVAFEGTPDERPRARVAKYLVDRLAEPDPDQCVLVATLRGDAVAVASLSFSELARGNPGSATRGEQTGSRSVPCPLDAAYLCNVAVDITHRNKGIAKTLLRAAEDFAKENGHADVWLHVRSSQPAGFALYLKSGYEVEAWETFGGGGASFGVFEKLASALGGEKPDVALMRKRLDAT